MSQQLPLIRAPVSTYRHVSYYILLYLSVAVLC